MLHELQGATLDLVEERGLDATTIGDIAARVGISDRTFVRYYSSKEDVLMPAQQELIDTLVAHPSKHISASGILGDLLAVCRGLFAQEVQQSDFRRISRLVVREPEMLRIATVQEQNVVESLSVALAWQTFVRQEFDGLRSDSVGLFDETGRELGELFPFG